jgi:anti-sigma B factor antagonist
MVAPFNIEAETLEGGIRSFRVSGELDQATAPELQKPLHDALNGGARAVLIDLTDCGFIDSTGLGVIVDAWKQLRDGNGAEPGLVVCCVDTEVARLLELTGLDKAIAIRETRDEALAVLQS